MRKKEDVVLNGLTVRVDTGCGSSYITVNADDKGKPVEIFASLGKSGTCVRHWMETVGRLFSLLVRSDTDVKRVIKTLKGIKCQESMGDSGSCADAFAYALEEFLKHKKLEQEEPAQVAQISEGEALANG